MKNRRHWVAVLLMLVSVVASPMASAASGEIDVVLLHGKGGSPTGYIRALASALQDGGNLVSTPEMPWAEGRIYDASFEDAMAEIDHEVNLLRQKGVKLVVVGGQSLGANAALGYAASRARVDGIIVLAPGHNPEQQAFAKRLGSDLSKARAMIAAGRGKEKTTFSDLNQGQASEVTASGDVYASWFDPAGLAVMPKSAAAIKSPIPLLFVVGSNDRLAPTKDYIYDMAPPHPMSKFVTVTANHLSVPTAAIAEVTAWLLTLRH